MVMANVDEKMHTDIRSVATYMLNSMVTRVEQCQLNIARNNELAFYEMQAVPLGFTHFVQLSWIVEELYCMYNVLFVLSAHVIQTFFGW
jgi:hypothetical protein